jgi:hypothetical protein
MLTTSSNAFRVAHTHAALLPDARCTRPIIWCGNRRGDAIGQGMASKRDPIIDHTLAAAA